MSFADDLLTVLLSYSGGYRLIRRRLHGYDGNSERREKSKKDYRVLVKEAKDATLRRTLSRLKEKGLVANHIGVWEITEKGKQYINVKKSDRLNFHQSYNHSKTKRRDAKNIIIAFDIPEDYKRVRNWLRVELRLLCFEPLQKSVWIGPAPLPENFIETLNELNLLRFLKFFKASEADII